MTDMQRRKLIAAEDRFADAMKEGRRCYIVKVKDAEVSENQIKACNVEILFTDKDVVMETAEFHFSDYSKADEFLMQMQQCCGLTQDMICYISKEDDACLS